MNDRNNQSDSPLARLTRFFTVPQPQAAGEPRVDQLQLATCVILLETATADHEFSPAERQHIMSVLRDRFSLSGKEAEELIEIASTHRSESVDLWHYTHQLNVSCTREEKLDIIAEVWRIIYMDKTLNRHEDYLVHKLAKLLNLDHPELIDVKMQVRREIMEQE